MRTPVPILIALLAVATQAHAQPATAPVAEPEPPPPPRAAGPEARDRWLAGRVDALIAAHPELGTARIGVAVTDLDSGRVVYRRRADEPFLLASCVKLFTTAAALSRLGREYQFATVLLADARPDASGVIAGDLYLRTSGDPSLDGAALWQLAGDLRTAGVRTIKGRLIIDDTVFDDDNTPPAFDQKLEDSAFRAPVSAASLNYNAVTVWVKPGAAAGAAARVVIDPPSDYFKVETTATTVDKGHPDLVVTSKPIGAGANAQTLITVAGGIRLDDLDGDAFGKPVTHPALYLAATLRTTLAAAGVHLAKHPLARAAVPKTAIVLARHVSAPLAVVMRDADLYSINFVAEALLKTLGAEGGGVPGTWAKGRAVVADFLAGIGIAPGTYRYDNGSGLYDSNRFTPAQVVTLLRAMYLDFRVASDFVAALPLAGADGTLARRLHGGAAERYVRAKTGTLAQVISLAGYAGGDGPGRPPLAFAVIVNDIPEKPASVAQSARALEADIVELLARFVDAE